MTLWDLYQKIPKRDIVSFLAFVGLTAGSSFRSALSIAIVAMVKPPNHHNSSLLHTV
jgi:hypothetical protein